MNKAQLDKSKSQVSSCPFSGYLTGSFTTQSAGYLTVEIIGANCRPGTFWAAALECNGSSNKTVFELSQLGNNEAKILTSVSDQAIEKQDVNIYPNPASKEVTISISNFSTEAICSFMDVSGRTVSKNIIKDKVSTIDLEGIPAGVYIVKIASKENDVIVKKLIIE